MAASSAAATKTTTSPADSAATRYNNNMTIRGWWTHGQPSYGIPAALPMLQRVNPSLPSVVAPGTVLIANMRNVGLVKRLFVEIAGTVTAGASGQTLQSLGLANLIATSAITIWRTTPASTRPAGTLSMSAA
jgi:hypothetical protein